MSHQPSALLEGESFDLHAYQKEVLLAYLTHVPVMAHHHSHEWPFTEINNNIVSVCSQFL